VGNGHGYWVLAIALTIDFHHLSTRLLNYSSLSLGVLTFLHNSPLEFQDKGKLGFWRLAIYQTSSNFVLKGLVLN
jgi:uncharacterized membrane protein